MWLFRSHASVTRKCGDPRERGVSSTDPSLFGMMFTKAVERYIVTQIRPPAMNNLLNLLIIVLIIGWLAGFFAFPNVGGIIHLLLVIALILSVYRLLTGRKIN